MARLNEVIHQPVRLHIMAILAAVSTERQVTFSFLKGTLGLTTGNLDAHLHKLEEAGGYLITKAFVRQKPQTYMEITERGGQVFEEHRQALKEILGEG